jgi:hypothetical protein
MNLLEQTKKILSLYYYDITKQTLQNVLYLDSSTRSLLLYEILLINNEEYYCI